MRSAAQLLLSAGIQFDELPDDLMAALRCPVRVAHPAFVRVWHPDVWAVTLPGVIFVRPRAIESDPEHVAELIVHEIVHVAQWCRLGPLRFMTRYVADYVRNRLRGWPHAQAYRGIGLESEARTRTDEFVTFALGPARDRRRPQSGAANSHGCFRSGRAMPIQDGDAFRH